MKILKRDNVPFRKRISYKQSRNTVFIAFILGVIISVVQIYWNYEKEQQEFEVTIGQVLSIVEKSATQAAYSLDKITAYEVLYGLFEYKAIYQATVYDDLGKVLAVVSGGKQKSIYRPITDYIFGEDRQYSVPLQIVPPPTDFTQMGKLINVGRLDVLVDTYPSGYDFINQAAIIFFSGLVRNLLLASILLFFFHRYLTKPFIRLEEAITDVDIDSPEKTKLYSPKGHENDEFSILVSATNRLIQKIQENIKDRIQKVSETERLRGEIEERKKREDALKEMQNQLEASNRELSNLLDDLRKTQNKLIQSEKMAALGEMVASIAHEINTPLGIGVMGASHLEDEVKKIMKAVQTDQLKKSDFEEFLVSSQEISQLITKNMDKAFNLIKSFKQVAVDQTSEAKRKFYVKAYIDEIINNLGAKIKGSYYKIELTCDDQLLLDSYPGAFSQIIMNFVMNSINHAFEDKRKGLISIDITERDKQIHFEYRDNGKGVAAGALSKIFDPFYTTNRDAGGSGLGLHIVYNIVKHRFNGSIDCESEPGKGIKFAIIFPKEV